MAAGIEAAIPAPRVLVVRNAHADRDRADLHIAVKNMPAFLGGIRRSAAGELGHAPIKARAGEAGKSSYRLGLEQSGDTANRGC
jgi:hypothetical protein